MARKSVVFLVRILIFAIGLGAALHGASAATTPWLPFGPDGGDARRLTTDPADHTHLLVGTASGWIFESHNGGTNWKRLVQIGQRDDLIIGSIFIDPTSAKHIIVGAYAIDHPDGGIFVSTDGGKTWINQAEMRGQSIRSLAASLSDPNSLVAGTLQGVFRTTDGGQRWKRISPIDSTEIHEVESIAIDPVDPDVIYAGTWHLPWKTTDGGEHWDSIKEGILDDSDVFSIIVDPKSPTTVYASACSGIYKSRNGGEKFEKIQGIPSTARRTRVLRQDPEQLDVVFAGTTEGLFRSVDAGKTWTRTTGPELIVNDVAIDPQNSKRVLIAIDRGGVLASDDGGNTFKPSNGGYSARQITSLRRDSRHPATLFVGVVNDKEWGGVFQSDNGGLNWTQRSEGLKGRDVFALGQAPDGSIIAGTSHGLFRLDSEAELWKQVDDNGPVEEAPAASGEAAHSAAGQIRPPVAIGRNHFAEQRVAPKNLTPGQKKAAAAKAKLKVAAKGTAASRRTQVSVAQKRALATKAKFRTPSTAKSHTGSKTTTVARGKTQTSLQSKPGVVAQAVPLSAKQPVQATKVPVFNGFDGGVYVLATAGDRMLATTATGLLSSDDNGMTWVPGGPKAARDWRYLAAAKSNVVGASMEAAQFSSDSGATWVPIKLPETLTRITSVAVEPAGNIWVGGREGVFVTTDAGGTWTTPKNAFVNSVSSLFYDETTNRIIMTTSSYSGYVFTLQLPERTVTYTDAGWQLRFARPVGDHLLGATLFDGIVIQPKLVASPATVPASTASVAAPAGKKD